jgi:hypothetical protein
MSAAKVAQRTPVFDPSLSLVVYQGGKEVYRILGLPQMTATEMAAALDVQSNLLAALREIASHKNSTAWDDAAIARAAIARVEGKS